MAPTLRIRFGPSTEPEPPLGAGRRAEDRYLRRAFWHHSRTFSFATRLLPRPVRLPVATVYLYCRTVDTLADARVHEIGVDEARRELGRMGERLDASFAGRPPSDGRNALLWRRLAGVHETYGLLPHAFHELLDGALWDLDGRPVTTDDDLLAYSNLVAGSVGAMVLPFLVRQRTDISRLEAPARALGNAMQITNILRDVGEDWRELGRTYLPDDALAGLDLDALAAGGPTPEYAARIEDLMARAEALYDTGLPAADGLQPRVQTGVRAAGRMYREILNEVRANAYDDLRQRAVVPLRRKLHLLLRDDYARRRDALRAVPRAAPSAAPATPSA